MKQLITAFFIIATSLTEAQQLYDFKVKNDANSKERTYMLDLVRGEVYREHSFEVKFVVEHFKVSNNYAWFEGTAQQKDGKPLVFDPDWTMDCCAVFSLFEKKNGIWTIAEYMSFCTDMCHWGIATRFPRAPKGIFPNEAGYFVK